MNIIQSRQEERRNKISSIVASLKKSKRFKKGELKKKDLVLMFMSEMSISKRTASEYVDVALFEMENE